MSENEANEYKDKVHWVLSYSYTFYLVLFLVGVFLDSIFKKKVWASPLVAPIGLLFLLLATLLVYWAQKTSRNLKKETLTKETFSKGPYAFTRNPTHWGLFLLTLGFGLTINALFIVLASVISFLVTKTVFLKKEEKILERKYGEPYRAYKKAVKF
jgi:protein-S-isoprenylcysteine O-methyltransferase Ste14